MHPPANMAQVARSLVAIRAMKSALNKGVRTAAAGELVVAKRNVVHVFRKHLPDTTNTHLAAFFELFVEGTHGLGTKSKWRFVRKERGFFLKTLFGREYGNTKTFRRLVGIMQTRGMAKWRVSRDKHGDAGQADDAIRIKNLLCYNPKRIRLFGRQTAPGTKASGLKAGVFDAAVAALGPDEHAKRVYDEMA